MNSARRIWRGERAIAPAASLCLTVTILAAIFAFGQAPKLTLRKAPGFIRYHTVERTLRGFLTTVTQGESFMRLLGVAVATVVVSVASMSTVKTLNEAGWLGFIPASGVLLTLAAGVIVVLFAAGARVAALPVVDPYIDMAMTLMALTFGVICVAVGKLSNW